MVVLKRANTGEEGKRRAKKVSLASQISPPPAGMKLEPAGWPCCDSLTCGETPRAAVVVRAAASGTVRATLRSVDGERVVEVGLGVLGEGRASCGFFEGPCTLPAGCWIARFDGGVLGFAETRPFCVAAGAPHRLELSPAEWPATAPLQFAGRRWGATAPSLAIVDVAGNAVCPREEWTVKVRAYGNGGAREIAAQRAPGGYVDFAASDVSLEARTNRAHPSSQHIWRTCVWA